jgi:hypothetical protein
MSKNKSNIIIGLLSFEHRVLRNDFDFVGENTFGQSAYRSYSYENRYNYFYYLGIALHKHYNYYQIHSQINQITLKYLLLWKLQKF